MNVTIAAALFAGMLSFLSPCVLPLVPPYLVYLTGTSIERLADAEPETRVKRETIIAALLFVLGFSTVFVALGAGASAIGALLRAYSSELSIVAGICIVVMGLHFLGLTPIAWLMREKRMQMTKPVGLWGAYLMGLAFALGWTPCIGPILAAILAVAASEDTVVKGAGMLAVYSLGLGVPFLLGGIRGRALRRLPRPLQGASRTGREGDGRPSGPDRHRLSHRHGERIQLLAARYVPGAWQDRLTSESADAAASAWLAGGNSHSAAVDRELEARQEAQSQKAIRAHKGRRAVGFDDNRHAGRF